MNMKQYIQRKPCSTEIQSKVVFFFLQTLQEHVQKPSYEHAV